MIEDQASTSLVDLRGFEYDWLACDGSGHVALFSTAGGGYAPDELRGDTRAFENAIAAILAAPATTTVRFAPRVAAGHTNTWQLVAERGLFAYDSDPEGGPYRLVAAPDRAAPLAELSQQVVEVVRRIFFPSLRFADLQVLGEQALRRD
jgi:hypothetical protein